VKGVLGVAGYEVGASRIFDAPGRSGEGCVREDGTYPPVLLSPGAARSGVVRRTFLLQRRSVTAARRLVKPPENC